MSDQITTVTDKDFKEKVNESRQPVYVDFWTPWAGPCQNMGQVMATVALEFGDRMAFVKCNANDHPDLAESYGIDSIPTVLIFKDGVPVDSITGAVPRQTVADVIKRALEGS